MPVTLTHPIYRLGREDADTVASFVATLDDEARQMRFHHFMTPEMVRAHYAAFVWDAAVVTAWITDATVHGLSEALLYPTSGGIDAEIVICVSREWVGRGVGQVLVTHAVAAAVHRGACRSIMAVACGDSEHANAARHFGATFDAEKGLFVLVHASNAEHQRAGRQR